MIITWITVVNQNISSNNDQDLNNNENNNWIMTGASHRGPAASVRRHYESDCETGQPWPDPQRFQWVQFDPERWGRGDSHRFPANGEHGALECRVLLWQGCQLYSHLLQKTLQLWEWGIPQVRGHQVLVSLILFERGECFSTHTYWKITFSQVTDSFSLNISVKNLSD